MRIGIYHHRIDINGSFLNCIDLSEYLKCDIYVSRYNLKKVIKLKNRIYRQHNQKILKLDNDRFDILICDYSAFLYILNYNIKINTEKLIVMDSLFLSLHQKGVTKDDYFYNLFKELTIEDLPNKIDEVLPNTELHFLMPKYNYDKWLYKKRYKTDVFYKKINFDIMNFPDISNNGYIFREDYNNTYYKNIYDKYPNAQKTDIDRLIYETENYIYYRRKYLSSIEQFGRLIFELYYTNHNIYLIDDIFKIHDSLYEYLYLVNSYIDNNKLIINDIDILNMNNYNYIAGCL
jgi:hypothetical protein